MSLKLIIKKFELTEENDAIALTKSLNAGKYPAVTLGTAVVTKCRATKKLEKMLSKFEVKETEPNEYDIEQVEK